MHSTSSVSCYKDSIGYLVLLIRLCTAFCFELSEIPKGILVFSVCIWIYRGVTNAAELNLFFLVVSSLTLWFGVWNWQGVRKAAGEPPLDGCGEQAEGGVQQVHRSQARRRGALLPVQETAAGLWLWLIVGPRSSCVVPSLWCYYLVCFYLDKEMEITETFALPRTLIVLMNSWDL